MNLRRKLVLYFERPGTERSLRAVLDRAFHVISSNEAATIEAAIRIYRPVIVIAEIGESYRRTEMILQWATTLAPDSRRIALCRSDAMSKGFDAVREGIADEPLIWPGSTEDLLSSLGMHAGAKRSDPLIRRSPVG